MKLFGLKTFSKIFAGLALMTFVLGVFPSAVFGQSSGEQNAIQEITSDLFLSFTQFPASFTFPSSVTSTSSFRVYSDQGATLPDTRLIKIQDTRDTGGFALQVVATNFTSPSGHVIPRDGLRIVTSTALAQPPAGTVDNDVLYITGFSGETGVNAPLRTTLGPTCLDFGQLTTFTSPACVFDPSANSLDRTVDLLLGSLPASQGRSGEMAVGVSYSLLVPAYSIPDTYHTVLTFTLSDATL